MLAYVIFADEEISYTCTVDFASPTLLKGTWDNSSSIVEWFLDVTFVILLFARTIAILLMYSSDNF